MRKWEQDEGEKRESEGERAGGGGLGREFREVKRGEGEGWEGKGSEERGGEMR